MTIYDKVRIYSYLLFLLPFSAAALDCDTRYKNGLAELDLKERAERKNIEQDFSSQQEQLKTQGNKTQGAWHDVIKQNAADPDSDREDCNTLFEKSESLSREIRSYLELNQVLATSGSSKNYDAEVAALQKQREQIEAQWQGCVKQGREKAASRPEYSERQKNADAAFQRYIADDRKFKALNETRQTTLEDSQRRYDKERDWLKQQYDYCKQHGEWVVTQTSQIDKKCACDLDKLTKRLLDVIQQQQVLDKKSRSQQIDLELAWEKLLNQVSHATKNNSNSDATHLNAAMQFFTAFAAKTLIGSLSNTSVQVGLRGGIASQGIAQKHLNKYLSAQEQSKYEKLFPAFKEVEKAKQALYKTQEELADLVKYENELWAELKQYLDCIKPRCELILDEELSYPASAEGARQARRDIFDEYSPIKRLDAAIGLHCELCKALQSIIEIRDMRGESYKQLTTLQSTIADNQSILSKLNLQLMSLLDRPGAMADASGYYDAFKLGVSLHPLGGITAASAESIVSLADYYYARVGDADESLRNDMQRIANVLEQNTDAVFYWRLLAKKLDKELHSALERLSRHCLKGPCEKDITAVPKSTKDTVPKITDTAVNYPHSSDRRFLGLWLYGPYSVIEFVEENNKLVGYWRQVGPAYAQQYYEAGSELVEGGVQNGVLKGRYNYKAVDAMAQCPEDWDQWVEITIKPDKKGQELAATIKNIGITWVLAENNSDILRCEALNNSNNFVLIKTDKMPMLPGNIQLQKPEVIEPLERPSIEIVPYEEVIPVY